MKNRLTDAKIRGIKATGKLQKFTDGSGLSLRVSPNGAKAWSYAYRITGVRTLPDGKTTTGKDGKVERAIGFGTYPEISLLQARSMLADARKLVALDQCPSQARKAAEEQKRREARNGDGSFRAMSNLFVQHNEGRWVPKYRDRVNGLLKNDILPVIGKSKLSAITPADIREIVLNKKGAPTAALKARQIVKEVFEWATANGLHPDINPALSLKVRKVIEIPAVVGHRPMSLIQLREFWLALEALEKDSATQPSTIAAAKWTLLTGVRKNETRLMEWVDVQGLFDEDENGEIGANAVWTVPAAKIKMKVDHRVPLTPKLVALLHEQHKRTGGRKYVFTISGKPLASCTFNAMWSRLRGVKENLTVHATRSTMVTILEDHGGFPRPVLEKLLAHSEKDSVSAAYHYPEFLSEKKAALDYYGKLIETLVAGPNVIPMKRKAA